MKTSLLYQRAMFTQFNMDDYAILLFLLGLIKVVLIPGDRISKVLSTQLQLQ